MKIAIIITSLLLCLSANAQNPTSDSLSQRDAAHFVNRPERLEDVPGAPRYRKPAPINTEIKQIKQAATQPCSCAPRRKEEQPTL